MQKIKALFVVLIAKLTGLIKWAEALDGLSGAEKKTRVIEAALKWIDIPWVPDFADRAVLKPLLSMLIDWLMTKYNAAFGHDGISNVPETREHAEEMAAKAAVEIASARSGEEEQEIGGDTDERFNELLEKYAVK
jgi:hypothetical protein